MSPSSDDLKRIGALNWTGELTYSEISRRLTAAGYPPDSQRDLIETVKQLLRLQTATAAARAFGRPPRPSTLDPEEAQRMSDLLKDTR